MSNSVIKAVFLCHGAGRDKARGTKEGQLMLLAFSLSRTPHTRILFCKVRYRLRDRFAVGKHWAIHLPIHLSAPWCALSDARRHDDHGVAGVAIALFNRRDR
jgi:hypothetical protein